MCCDTERMYVCNAQASPGVSPTSSAEKPANNFLFMSNDSEEGHHQMGMPLATLPDSPTNHAEAGASAVNG